MMLWMYLLDPQNHILKVLCHNLEFWLSYSGSLNKLLTSEKREERREREERQVILVVALPNATVGQKAEVGQGLPNFQTVVYPYINPVNYCQHLIVILLEIQITRLPASCRGSQSKH